MGNVLDLKLPNTPVWKVRYLAMDNGMLVISVVELRKYAIHIAVEECTWVIIHKGKRHPWIFPDVMDIFRMLPSTPLQYAPYIDFIRNPQPVA